MADAPSKPDSPPRPSETLMDKACQELIDEMVEDLTLEMCFKAHRDLKFGKFPVAENSAAENSAAEEESVSHDSENPNQNPEPIFEVCANPTRTLYTKCPHCNRDVPADLTFTRHLYACMYGEGNQPERKKAKRLHES